MYVEIGHVYLHRHSNVYLEYLYQDNALFFHCGIIIKTDLFLEWRKRATPETQVTAPALGLEHQHKRQAKASQSVQLNFMDTMDTMDETCERG